MTYLPVLFLCDKFCDERSIYCEHCFSDVTIRLIVLSVGQIAPTVGYKLPQLSTILEVIWNLEKNGADERIQTSPGYTIQRREACPAQEVKLNFYPAITSVADPDFVGTGP
jgi:hypothetical protein